MKVSEVMSWNVKTIAATGSIQDAARLMRQHDIGSLPVADGERLVGMVTDRDLVVRALASSLPATSAVQSVMSEHVHYCFDDQDLDEVVRDMANLQVRRLPVVDRDKRLVGFLSLSNVAAGDDDKALTGELLDSVATPH